MSEKKAGDPVLDYVEKIVEFIRDHGLDWRFPTNFTQYPEHDQRAYLWNLYEVCNISTVTDAPPIPDNVKSFMEDGPRPEPFG